MAPYSPACPARSLPAPQVMALTGAPSGVIAIDGKTVRRSHNKKNGKAAIHMVSAFAAQQPVGYAKVFGGDSRSVKLASPEPIKVMVQKNGTDKLIARVIYSGPVRAPIESGQQVGIVKVWRGANVAVEAPVYAAESVGKGSTMRRAIDGVSELAIGMFRAGAEKL